MIWDLFLGFCALVLFPILWVGLILTVVITAMDKSLHPECWDGLRYFCCECREPTCRKPHPTPLRWGSR